MKRMVQRIDAAPVAEKLRSATDVGADRVASRADFSGTDGIVARAAMQRIAVDVHAVPAAGLERRAVHTVRRGRGVALDGRKIIRQALRAAEQECPDPGGARTRQHPHNSAR